LHSLAETLISSETKSDRILEAEHCQSCSMNYAVILTRQRRGTLLIVMMQDDYLKQIQHSVAQRRRRRQIRCCKQYQH